MVQGGAETGVGRQGAQLLPLPQPSPQWSSFHSCWEDDEKMKGAVGGVPVGAWRARLHRGVFLMGSFPYGPALPPSPDLLLRCENMGKPLMGAL